MRGPGKVPDVPGLTTRFCPCTHPRNGTFFFGWRGGQESARQQAPDRSVPSPVLTVSKKDHFLTKVLHGPT